MTIGKIFKKKVKTINKDLTIREAAKIMANENVGFLVVTDSKDNSLVGTLTDRDIITQVIAKGNSVDSVKISEVMCLDILVLKDDQSIQEIIKLLGQREVRRAPIINGNDELVGVVSMDDLLILLAQEIGTLAGIVSDQMS